MSKDCKPVDTKLHSNTSTTMSIRNQIPSPVRQHIIRKVEQRLRKIFSFALQDQLSSAGIAPAKLPPLTPHEISAHFYKNSNNGQIGLSDFQVALHQLGIFIEPNECHELMKLIAAPLKHHGNKYMEISVNIDTFLKFFFESCEAPK